MIGLSLSGGGSRAIAFHLGCLRALNELGLLDRIGVLSTISGGSVIGAYYAYTPKKTFEEFESDIRGFLLKGFQLKIFLELIKLKNLPRVALSFGVAQVQEAAAMLFKMKPKFHRKPSLTDMFPAVLSKDVFPGLTMGSPRRKDMEIVIGACELRTGTAFRFGNGKSGGWRQGEMVAWNVDVAFAVAASAAYPIFFPAFDRTFKFRREGGCPGLLSGFLRDAGGVDQQAVRPGRAADKNPRALLS